ncbi:hypothetical protein KY285_003560 [Solanum tuberosum]|nr:hypothetical protein KY284_003711 [Solanum tuberosum]KAH0767689.1 hypothetical protein KY285_003560 [Solanum tuberosum]
MKLHNDSLEVSSLLGDLKQEVAVLKEQLQRFSFKEEHSLEKQLEEVRTAQSEAESKIRELKDSLEKVQRETEELTVKHHSYICYKCQRHVSSHEDIISTKFQSKKGKAFLFAHVRNVVVGTNEEKHLTAFTQLMTYTVWIATRYWTGSMNKLLSHRRSTRKGNSYLSYEKLLKTIGNS